MNRRITIHPGLRQFAVLCLMAAATYTVTDAQATGGKHHYFGHSINISSHDDSDSTDCAAHLQISSDDLQGHAETEENVSLPNQPLKITASQHGGIQVRNWDKPEIGVRICKASVAKDDSTAAQVLSQIKATRNGGELTIEGPSMTWDDDDHDRPVWSSLVMVFAPKGATLDLNAHNGGISVRNSEVNATAHTVNGGISLVSSGGKLNVEAQNGGISIKDCHGDITANVQNGGVDLKLPKVWEGGKLDANTHNGGVSVQVPDNFSSALEVESRGYGRFSCEGDLCDSAQKNWDNNTKSLKIGAGSPVIHASTVNGGIVVKRRGHDGDI
jgi:DUF4097 and DUF4098 domain-containing protein YvlB